MFLRSVKAPNGRHQYLRLVESFREGNKVKQRIVAHLGRKDLLAPHLDTLVRLLQAEVAAPRWVSADQISTPRASTWGPILVARHLFDQLSLGSIYWTRAKRRPEVHWKIDYLRRRRPLHSARLWTTNNALFEILGGEEEPAPPEPDEVGSVTQRGEES